MPTARFAFDGTQPDPTDRQPSVSVEFLGTPTEIGLTLTFSCCDAQSRVVMDRPDFDGPELTDAQRDDVLLQVIAKAVSTACLDGGHGGVIGAMDATMRLAQQATVLKSAWRAHWRTALQRDGGLPS